MVVSDPIADMLTRIRNAVLVKAHIVRIPHSKIKEEVANTLLRLGFISSVKLENPESVKKEIVIDLKYVNRESALSTLIRESKPGRRKYTQAKDARKHASARRPQHAVSIWSTSKGVLSEDEAKAQNVGGEELCTIW